jgi:hypothetical protein
MSSSRRTRAAALCAALSTALAVGMAVMAAAFSPPAPPGALILTDRPAVSSGVPTTPATAGRTPAP